MLFAFWFALPVHAAPLSADLTEFFSGEEARVRIQVQLGKGATPPKLLRTDRNHDKIVAVLNDDGVFGDRKAGDGIFSRSILFKENLTKTIQLHLEGQTETLALTVKARPTLQEIISNIWSRMRDRFHHS